MACYCNQTKLMTLNMLAIDHNAINAYHQRLFRKKNKNHLERKVLPADLEHTCMYNKIKISEAENLGYVKI